MDKFCLKWENFQKNINSAFEEWRDDQDFTDVTLACDDEFIDVHKIVLSSSSPFFKRILNKMKNRHPTIYMIGMKFKDLVSIIDFIYHGEVNIYQEDLASFLTLAEEMELNWLKSSSDQDHLEQEQVIRHAHDNKTHPTAVNTVQLKNEYFEYSEIETNPVIKRDTITKQNYSKQLVPFNGDLAEQIDSMLEKRDGLWTCTICGVKKSHKGHTKEHVEIHVEGLALPCNNCGKIFRYSTSIKKIHRNNHI